MEMKKIGREIIKKATFCWKCKHIGYIDDRVCSNCKSKDLYEVELRGIREKPKPIKTLYKNLVKAGYKGPIMSEHYKVDDIKEYIEDYVNLNMSDDDIQIWKKGAGEELKKVIGIGMFDLKFERDGTKVTISYEEEEGNKVHEAICKFLEKEGNFDKLCDNFWGSIYKKWEIQEKMLPALIIFDEIDRYPEIASDDDKRRLMRVRESTHEESYK